MRCPVLSFRIRLSGGWARSDTSQWRPWLPPTGTSLRYLPTRLLCKARYCRTADGAVGLRAYNAMPAMRACCSSVQHSDAVYAACYAMCGTEIPHVAASFSEPSQTTARPGQTSRCPTLSVYAHALYHVSCPTHSISGTCARIT
eukprot:816648-Rhodomonas_salina.5